MKVFYSELLTFCCNYRSTSIAILLASASCSVLAQLSGAAAIEQQQQLRQQERERELRDRMAPDADILRPTTTAATLDIPENESPCFNLHRLELTGKKLTQVSWLKESAGVDFSTAPCIGSKGVEVILARMQQAVIEHGYVTSRVMVVPQNLRDGVLTVAFVPGVLREIKFSADSTSNTSLLTALPSKEGELL